METGLLDSPAARCALPKPARTTLEWKQQSPRWYNGKIGVKQRKSDHSLTLFRLNNCVYYESHKK